MQIEISGSSALQTKCDALILGRCQEEPFDEVLNELDRLLEGGLSRLPEQELKGTRYSITSLTPMGQLPARRIVLVGLGARQEIDAHTLLQATAVGVRELKGKGYATLATNLHTLRAKPEDARPVVEGALMALFETSTYQKEPISNPEALILTDSDAKKIGSLVEQGQKVGEAVNLARSLVNEPANRLTPTALAEHAQQVAQRAGLNLLVLDEDEMFKLGMGCLLAVARGSQERAKLIVLSHRPNLEAPFQLGLVGKGITFDTGGISLKPRDGLERLKGDMAGAAAVIAAMQAIGQLKLPLNVIGVAPAVENMPDGNAYRPGDVLYAMNGKTVEIISTDAEGRLILADALTYTAQQGAERIVDVATLTGAVGIALGPYAIGAMTNNAELLQQVREAGEQVGERIWELPLWEEYKNLIKSSIADLKNAAGSPTAGSIVGGVFLREFVEGKPWVHLDIAATASVGDHQPGLAQGPSGVPVRTLVRLAERMRG